MSRDTQASTAQWWARVNMPYRGHVEFLRPHDTPSTVIPPDEPSNLLWIPVTARTAAWAVNLGADIILGETYNPFGDVPAQPQAILNAFAKINTREKSPLLAAMMACLARDEGRQKVAFSIDHPDGRPALAMIAGFAGGAASVSDLIDEHFHFTAHQGDVEDLPNPEATP